jgi:methionine-rich copper-binding protein CopC
MRISLARAVLGASLLLLLPLATALGHAELDTASPGPGDSIAGSPPELVARFTQDLRPDRTSLELRDPTGQTIAKGGKDPDRPRVQRMALPSLAPGQYEVRWVSFSAEDGELARGKYRFTVVDVPATPSPAPMSPAPCPTVPPDVSPATSVPPGASPWASPPPATSQTPSASPLPAASEDPVPVSPCTSPDPGAGPSSAPTTAPSVSPVP